MNIKKLLNPKCSFYALYLYALRSIYNFDAWHYRNNYFCRKYKKKLVQYLNSLPIKNVSVELGGGLGEIVGRLKTKENILIDIDENVVKASKYILFTRITKRIVGSWDKLILETPKNIDLLITVNWIHGIEPKTVENYYKQVISQKEIEYIVVDILREPWKGSYKHSFDFLLSLGYKIENILDDGGERISDFMILKRVK